MIDLRGCRTFNRPFNELINKQTDEEDDIVTNSQLGITTTRPLSSHPPTPNDQNTIYEL